MRYCEETPTIARLQISGNSPHAADLPPRREIGLPRDAWPAAALIVAAIVLGGGGSPTPAPELLLQWVAAICALGMIFGPLKMRGRPPATASAWIVAGLVVALPAIQLVPLPPQIWHAMPGRTVAVEALNLVSGSDEWRPWSLFPDRTFAALVAVVPPAILLLAISRLDPQAHRGLLAIVAAMALLSVVLGALQLAGGAGSPMRFYSQSNPGFLNGFQANRNAQGDVLLIGIAALAAIAGRPSAEKRARKWAAGAAFTGALLALGVVLTGSRTAMALLVPMLGFATIFAFGAPRHPLRIGAALAVLAAGAAFAIQSNAVLRAIFVRVTTSGDYRDELWADAIFAIHGTWPFGAGLGSAAPMLTIVERLEVLDPLRPNRVHNDFLELVLETGVFGPIVLAVVTTLLIRGAVLQLRNKQSYLQAAPVAAIAILFVIAFHSVADYPLRSMSLAHLAALAGGILLARRGLAGDGGVKN